VGVGPASTARDNGPVAALDQISWVVVGYAVLIALVAGFAAYRWRERPPWLASMAWMLEALLALRAVAGLGVLLSGREPDEVSTHVGYLIASVCIMPLALRSVQDDHGAWSLGVVGVSAVAVAAVSVRIVMTL
jgi:hypothetical protein